MAHHDQNAAGGAGRAVNIAWECNKDVSFDAKHWISTSDVPAKQSLHVGRFAVQAWSSFHEIKLHT